MAKNQTKYAAKKRAEMKKMGMVERKVWVYPEGAEELKSVVAMLNNRIEILIDIHKSLEG